MGARAPNQSCDRFLAGLLHPVPLLLSFFIPVVREGKRPFLAPQAGAQRTGARKKNSCAASFSLWRMRHPLCRED